ncbi:MAG: COP23 domain-containing protein [Stigonema ocellatum SAG 48.90 = DSM 106950]|nr:COP23 domain-containing protein [Stigonema ocellatum SAG 48.90 = DSM 106950]
MRRRLFARVLAGVAKVFGITSLTASATVGILNQPSYAEGTNFYCAGKNGVPVTFVHTQDGRKKPVIYWATNNSFPPPWTPMRRCEEVSRRFQINFDNGTLKFINAGTLLGQPVVCGAIRKDDPCKYTTLLFTLKRNSDPKSILISLQERRELEIKNSSVVTSTGVESHSAAPRD